MGLSVPGAGGRRGEVEGEARISGAFCSSSNCSSERASAAVLAGRGRARGPGGQSTVKPCQEGAPHENKARGTKERARVVEDSPEKKVVAGGHGGAPGVRVRGLGAGCSREWGQKGGGA